jgi:mycothiol synthase
MTAQTHAAGHVAAGAATVRGFEPGDETAILDEMLAALERGEYEAMERYQLEHAAERLAPSPGSCAVAVADGRLAGWVIPADDDLKVVPAFRRRGIGRLLVEAGRGIAAADGRDRLRLWVPRQPAAEAFAAACGMHYTSSLWQMRLAGDAVAVVPDPDFPAAVAVRTLEPGRDEEPFVALANRIFLDHPSPIELSLDEVRRVHATPGFDPTTVLVVEDADSGAMVGFCRVHPFADSAGTPSGEIRLLGVDRAWRGRGLGRAVTSWGVAELRRRGARSVVLAVEGENQGALRLYTELGFRFGAEWPHWTVDAAPVAR